MCRPTVDDDDNARFRPWRRERIGIRGLYLRMYAAAPAEPVLVYLPAIGGAPLELNGRVLPPATPAPAELRRFGPEGAAAYASADRVAAGEGARFEVYAGEERAAEGVFIRRPGGGWRVECRRTPHAAAAVAEVVVIAEGGVVMRDNAKASRRGLGCGRRLEGIPEEAAADGECECECGTCMDEWEVVGHHEEEEEEGMETVRWAVDVGMWAVCLGVGLLVSRATARRLGRKRVFW